MADDKDEEARSLIVAGVLAGRPAIQGVAVLCLKLVTKGIFDRQDVIETFGAMELAVADVGGDAKGWADEERKFIREQRDIVLTSPLLPSGAIQ